MPRNLPKRHVKTIVKKYSDHISVGIHFIAEDGTSEQAIGDALWTRSLKDISDEDYKNFYQSHFMAFDDPSSPCNRSEGTLEFTNLLFVPSRAPFDLYDPERK